MRVVWLTGLPCSGKTTIGKRVVSALNGVGRKAVLLDGDEIRRELWPELGYSHKDRDENVLRFGLLAAMFARQGVVTVVSVVSPYRAARDAARGMVPDSIEVYVNAPLEICEERDVKGMYKRARAGEIALFTGVSDSYEPPLNPEIECRTDLETIDHSVAKILRHCGLDTTTAHQHTVVTMDYVRGEGI